MLVYVQEDLLVGWCPLNCLCLWFAAKLEVKTPKCCGKGISYFYLGESGGIQEILQESFFSEDFRSGV